jgi:MOSC domain-containing protein YiiM
MAIPKIRKMGELKAIWIKRAKRGPMDAYDCAELVVDQGIKDNANQGGRRQVTLIEEEVWRWLMDQHGSDLPPNTRRANLMVAGFSLKDSRKKILRVGDCHIQIFGETKPCERMEAVAPGLQEAVWPDWRGGAFAQVVQEGELRVGDLVEWVDGDA